MPFYLSEYIGTGTRIDPFRPAGSTQPDWAAIDLRPDGGATLDGGGLNACLLWVPAPTSDPKTIFLADTKDSPLTNPTRNFIQSKLGVDLTGVPNTFSDIVGHIMRNPGPNKWNAVLPTTDRYEVWLGGLVYEAPAS